MASNNSGNGSNGYATSNTSNIAGAGLTGQGYAAPTSSSQRPSSAGHSRGNRHHQTSSNNHIHGHNYGSVGAQSSGSNNSGIPPSNVPMPSQQAIPVSSQPISHILNAHHIPSQQQHHHHQQQQQQPQQYQQAYPSMGVPTPQPGYTRPKSAGAVRRAPTAAPSDQQVPRTINLANVYGGTSSAQQQQYQMYAQQQQYQ